MNRATAAILTVKFVLRFSCWRKQNNVEWYKRMKQRTKKAGRPSSYKSEFNKVVYQMALLGATDKQIAAACGVSEVTLNAWKKEQPDFLKSLKKGKDNADSAVSEMLFKRATGYDYKAVKIFNNNGTPLVVPYVEHYPPDVTACIFWLKNRQPAAWRDKQDVAVTADENLAVEIAKHLVKSTK
jgi:hypothetical protein